MKNKKLVMNSSTEFGLRALVILSQLKGEGIDIDRLLIYDYLLTNSGEFNEKLPSLHVDTPYKYSKLIVKREVLREGVKKISDQGLIDVTLTEKGIYYKKNSYTDAFLVNMTSKYKEELQNISKWIIEDIHLKDECEIEDEIKGRILQYGIEFYRE